MLVKITTYTDNDNDIIEMYDSEAHTTVSLVPVHEIGLNKKQLESIQELIRALPDRRILLIKSIRTLLGVELIVAKMIYEYAALKINVDPTK